MFSGGHRRQWFVPDTPRRGLELKDGVVDCGLGGRTAGLTSVFLPQSVPLQIHEHGKIETCFPGLWESPNNPGLDLFWVMAWKLVVRKRFSLSISTGASEENNWNVELFAVICTDRTICCTLMSDAKKIIIGEYKTTFLSLSQWKYCMVKIER